MISMIRSGLAIPTVAGMDELPARAGRPTKLRSGSHRVAEAPLDGWPIWIHLPIAEAERLSPSLEMPRYCEARRCQSKHRTATTLHALISPVGEAEAESVWVACAECTHLMLEGAYAT
jgi:hypothetical protein